MSNGYEPRTTNHHLNLLGSVVISIPGNGVNTFSRLFEDALGDLKTEFKILFADSPAAGVRVVLQYKPGSDGKEAGSRWFDLTDSDVAAQAVIDYLSDIEEGFEAGETFVA